MSWDRLADRCQLFVSTHKGMLIELLKEAEEELARECKLFEMTKTYSTPFDSASDYCLLPEDFNSVQHIYYNGNQLQPIDESSLNLDENNDSRSGTPSYYYIKRSQYGSRIMFDRYPTTGTIRLEYISLILSTSTSKTFINTVPGTNQVVIPTRLNAELDGLDGVWIDPSAIALFTDLTYVETIGLGAKYSNTLGGTITAGALVEVYNYRSIAPIIPSQYHKDLCDYAIAIASAQVNPDLHNKHLSIWMNNIEKVKNEDADKELIFTMRSEV